MGGIGRAHVLENLNQPAVCVIRQLEQRFLLPAFRDAFEMQRRKFPLKTVGESEIQLRGFPGFAMAQECPGLARIVVAVVVEEDDLAADFFLESACGVNFSGEKSFREKSTWLLAEANDGGWTHGTDNTGAASSVGPRAVWIIRLNSTQMAHPIKLYQR